VPVLSSFTDGETIASGLTTGSDFTLGTLSTRYAKEASPPEIEHGYYLRLTSVYPEQQSTRVLTGEAHFNVGGDLATVADRAGILVNQSTSSPSPPDNLVHTDSIEMMGGSPGTARLEIYDQSGTANSYFLTLGEIVYQQTGTVSPEPIPVATTITKLPHELNELDKFTTIAINDTTTQWLLTFSHAFEVSAIHYHND